MITFKDRFLDENHYKLIKKRLVAHCKLAYGMKFQDLFTMIAIHLSFEDLKPELYLFSKFAQMNPMIIEQILKSDNMESNLCYQASRIFIHKISNIT